MSGILNTITQLIAVASDTYKRDYTNKEYFVAYYMENDEGFLKVLNESNLSFPIQFEEEGDFYFFDNGFALSNYIVAFLENNGTIDSMSDYYSSSAFNNSGC